MAGVDAEAWRMDQLQAARDRCAASSFACRNRKSGTADRTAERLDISRERWGASRAGVPKLVLNHRFRSRLGAHPYAQPHACRNGAVSGYLLPGTGGGDPGRANRRRIGADRTDDVASARPPTDARRARRAAAGFIVEPASASCYHPSVHVGDLMHSIVGAVFQEFP